MSTRRLVLLPALAAGLVLTAGACSKSNDTVAPAPAPTTTVFDGVLPDDPSLTAVPGGGTATPTGTNPVLAPDPVGEQANDVVVGKLDACSQQAGGCRGMQLDFVTPAPGTDYSNRDFSGAKLQGADFTEVVLVKADFRNADLAGALFMGADLTDADFTGANLEGAIFQGAKVTDAQLEKGRLCGTINADGDTVDKIC